MSDEENEKKPINVCLVDAPPFVYKDELGNNKGIEYEVFNSFAKEAKLKVNYTFLNSSGVSYNDVIDEVANGKYDVFMGNIGQTKERAQKVLYGQPMNMDYNSFIYYDANKGNIGNINILDALMFILKLIAIILMVSFIISIFHYATSPFKTSFKESLWRVASALFGEPGFGVEPNKFNGKIDKMSANSLILRTFIVFLSSIIGIYVTASISAYEVSKNLTKKYTKKSDLNGKTILCLKGNIAETELVPYSKEYNFKLLALRDEDTEYDNDYDELKGLFLKNKDKVDGIYQPTESFLYYENKDSAFKMSDIYFEQVVTGLVFNKKLVDLSMKYNQHLFHLRDINIMTKLCKRYFKRPEKMCIE
jgi:ABC-type amino acid transport substrate-binding protein